MWDVRAEGIMIGHQDSAVYGHDWKYEGVSDIKRVIGSYPAVFGWEIGDLGVGAEENLDGVHFGKMREKIIWVHEQGGINTISWHARNVLTGGDSWDVSSDQVVKSILPGGEKEAEYAAMLDRVADFFQSFRGADGKLVPVIFRPYHEHTGSWFWWGEKLCTPEQYIALWKYTIDCLWERGAHNMIIAYSSASHLDDAAAFLERYPGDAYADILGFDTYQHGTEGRKRYMADLANCFDIVEPIAREKQKLLILAETGIESVPVDDWWTETLWPRIKDRPISYVLFWRNAYDRADHYYAPFPGQRSAEDFKRFAAFERTLFLEDIQD